MKRTLKSALSPAAYQRLRRFKTKLRRQRLFLTKGVRYLTVGAALKRSQAVVKDLLWRARGCPGKKILWVGCFDPWHRNIGDQEQTLALELFFKDKFPEYHLLIVTRHEFGTEKWRKVVASVTPDDLVMIHSTGDFGSKYYSQKSYAGGLSWAEARREIVATFPGNKVIQLPVTVFYTDDAEGKEVAADDKAAYSNRDFTVMCREGKSLEILTRNETCAHDFFPDFVFYLKSRRAERPRSGVLLMLRGKDKESLFDDAAKGKVRELLESATPNVHVDDLMKAEFPLVPAIRERFISELMESYQGYELIVTDRMHGMITSVITKTPCIALDEAIPHKLSGYRDILGRSVTFVDDIGDLPSAVKQVLSSPYVSTDFGHYFEDFRGNYLAASKAPDVGKV